MAKRYGKCTNFGSCPIADSYKVVEINEGDEFNCPRPPEGCGLPLYSSEPPPEPPNKKWLKIILIIIPVLVALFFLIKLFILSTPACKGWECDGSYVAQNDTSVSVFNETKKLNKNDTLIVKNKIGTINPFKKPPERPGPAPEPNRSTDTVNHFTGYFYKPPILYIDKDDSKLKAIVEMGATGFDYYVVRINPQKQWELVQYKPGWSLAFEGDATAEDIVPKLRNYIAEILNMAVKAKYIYFIISSGAREQKNVPQIIEALHDLDYVVNVVTPEQEARYALKCTLPDIYKGKAFVVDMGSSNTKIAWEENGKDSTRISYGSKYRQIGVRDSAVYYDVVKSLQGMPAACRENCFIIGGVPYQLANLSRSGDERYTQLKSATAYDPHGNDKLIAGLNIYKAIGDATACKKFAFDWSSHFGVGYLLTLKY